MKPFSELFTNNFFGITFVVFICTQSIVNCSVGIFSGTYTKSGVQLSQKTFVKNHRTNYQEPKQKQEAVD